MLPANVISALQVLSNSGKPLIAAAQDTPAPITKLEPGQQLQGAVQSKISEGLFKVQVAGEMLQMRLPANIRSGDVIKLEVLAIQPRITFGMVASTNPLSTPEQIGSTARLLSNLAELPIERPIVQQLGNKAVWPAAQQAPDAKQLAEGLREALGKSGLFYESHQAQWVRGERSTSQLLQEPQNLLTGKSFPLPALGQRAAQNTNPMPGLPENELPAFGAGSGDRIPATQDSSNSQAMAKSAGDTAMPVAKELVHLVQQQLHTLEQHHLVWMGQVWPGQQMQWEIQGQPEHQGRQQDERQWSTEMELDLPRLGGVHARLVFAASGLRLTLNAADQATVDLFNRALPKLKNSLADAGIALAAAAVEKS
ncbi:MAG: flagellar hook-length control protein FliK [Nitrosomonadales bacterium]|nr:flagellar hook-length control protein FliK [Nitrosomonadales bacterium]